MPMNVSARLLQNRIAVLVDLPTPLGPYISVENFQRFAIIFSVRMDLTNYIFP